MKFVSSIKIKYLSVIFLSFFLSACLDECHRVFGAPGGCFTSKNQSITQTCATQPLTQQEQNDSWKLLFTGNDLDDNWTVVDGRGVNIRGWNNEDGCINVYERERDGALRSLDALVNGIYNIFQPNIIEARVFKNLVSKDQYRNFEFKADFRVVDYANSGIHFRANPTFSFIDSLEFAIIDDQKHPNAPVVNTGWLFGGTRDGNVDEILSNPVGEWNQAHIIANDQSITMYLNGEISYQGQVPENRVREGVIALQDHWGGISFKNVKVRDLD